MAKYQDNSETCTTESALPTIGSTGDSDREVADKAQPLHAENAFVKLSTMNIEFDRVEDFEGIPSEINVIMVGKTGHGLSSSGNTILGKQLFQVQGFSSSVTQKIQCEQTTCKHLTLKVADTPGLFNTQIKDNDDVFSAIAKYATSLPFGVHALLLTVSLKTRFTDEEVNVFNEIKVRFGSSVFRHVITVFTHGSTLLKNKDLTLQKFIKEQADEAFLKKYEFVRQKSIALENENNDFCKPSVQRNLILCAIVELVRENKGEAIPKEVFQSVFEDIAGRQERRDKLEIIQNVINEKCHKIIENSDQENLTSILATRSLNKQDIHAIYAKIKAIVLLPDMVDIIRSKCADFVIKRIAVIEGKLEEMRRENLNEKENKIISQTQSKVKFDKTETEKKEQVVIEQILPLSAGDLQLVLQRKFSKTIAKRIQQAEGLDVTEDEVNTIVLTNNQNITSHLNKREMEEYRREVTNQIQQNILTLIQNNSPKFLKSIESGKLSHTDFKKVVDKIPYPRQDETFDFRMMVSSIIRSEAFLCEAEQVVAKRYFENLKDDGIAEVISKMSEESVRKTKKELTQNEAPNTVFKALHETIRHLMSSSHDKRYQVVHEYISKLLQEKIGILVDAIELKHFLNEITETDLVNLIYSFDESLKSIKEDMDEMKSPHLLLEKLNDHFVHERKCFHSQLSERCLFKLCVYRKLDDWVKKMIDQFYRTMLNELVDIVEARLQLEAIQIGHIVRGMQRNDLENSRLQLTQNKVPSNIHSEVIKLLVETKSCRHVESGTQCIINENNECRWLKTLVKNYLKEQTDFLKDLVEANINLQWITSDMLYRMFHNISNAQEISTKLFQNESTPTLSTSLIQTLNESKKCSHKEPHECLLSDLASNQWLEDIVKLTVQSKKDEIIDIIEITRILNELCEDLISFLGNLTKKVRCTVKEELGKENHEIPNELISNIIIFARKRSQCVHGKYGTNENCIFQEELKFMSTPWLTNIIVIKVQQEEKKILSVLERVNFYKLAKFVMWVFGIFNFLLLLKELQRNSP